MSESQANEWLWPVSIEKLHVILSAMQFLLYYMCDNWRSCLRAAFCSRAFCAHMMDAILPVQKAPSEHLSQNYDGFSLFALSPPKCPSINGAELLLMIVWLCAKAENNILARYVASYKCRAVKHMC